MCTMEPSNTIATLLMLSAILLSIPSATSHRPPQADAFIQCLVNKASMSPRPISGAIYAPDHANFSSVYMSYFRNKRFMTPGHQKPVTLVAAKHESHVQATVICAKNHGLLLRIRSGGHDYEGLSYVANEPFALLDMFNLRSIDINIRRETAWVQAGATLGELYHNISHTSKTHAFPGGVCSTVCTGGHFLGAGYGTLMRKYGLSVDNIVDARLVDVNGRILNRRSMGEDLFWAIRGGGASFGVILSWKINLVSVPQVVTYFQVLKTLEQNATDVVYSWQRVAPTLPGDIFIRLEIHNDQFRFIALYLGKSQTLIPMMNQRFPELGLQKNDCVETSWAGAAVLWDRNPNGTSLDALLKRENGPVSFKVKSDCVKSPIRKAALVELWNHSMKMGLNLVMQWNPYGGIMSRISESATPNPHRGGYLFKIQYWYLLDDQAAAAGDQTSLELFRNFYDFMAQYVTNSPREAFLNYRDLDIGTNEQNGSTASSAAAFGAKYFKGNFERLMRVKTRVDPGNFFRNEQSIPPLPAA